MPSITVIRNDDLEAPGDAGRKILRYAGLPTAVAKVVAQDLYGTGAFRQVFVKSEAGGYLEIHPQPIA